MHLVTKYTDPFMFFPQHCKKQLLGFVEQTTTKLCAAGCVVRTVGQVHVSDINYIKLVYYA